jgi:arginine decarboxylase
MTDWSPDLARKTYSIPHWGTGISTSTTRAASRCGRRARRPGHPPARVVDASLAQGGKLPVLVRFPDILGDRLGKLQAAFAQAQQGLGLRRRLHRDLSDQGQPARRRRRHLAAHHGEGFGLEAGSKPELMAVLALSRPGGVIVCNGYKDREYIRLALIGRKLGLQTYIVIEKPSELELVIEEARALGVKPGLGVRMRLASLGAGKWQNSGGDKAKFGLDRASCWTCGSCAMPAWATACNCCISTWARRSPTCATSPTACARRRATSSSCRELGSQSLHVDVGGGLGVDYEGTRSRSYCSINYGIHQYAASIVQPLAEACASTACRRRGCHRMRPRDDRAPRGAGGQRVGSRAAPEGRVPEPHAKDRAAVRHLREMHDAK